MNDTPLPLPDTSRPPRAFVAPLLATVLALPMAAVAFFFVGMSPMACDSCGTAASDRFDASYQVAFPVFGFGLLIVPAALLVAWALRRQRASRSQPATSVAQ